MALTKLICTIGPSSNNPKIIRELVKNGMTAARINTAFGDANAWKLIIKNIRKVSDVPIIFDLKGPDTRVLVEKERWLKKGEVVIIGLTKAACPQVYFNRDISRQISTGNVLVINAGLVKFKVISKNSDCAKLQALNSGFLKNGGSVHSLTREFDLPVISEHDKTAIKLAKSIGEEVFALSMVRSKQDIEALRRIAGTATIIAKIESRSAVANINEIIDASDVIMIARGDLGIELPVAKVPLIQKEILSKCRAAGKAAIVATQMLESMISSPVPTRADVSDIANAIIDGADCLMLSGETANGKYPVLAVKTIADVAKEIENSHMPGAEITGEGIIFPKNGKGGYSEVICNCVKYIANNTNTTKILTPTKSGFTPRMISKFRIGKPIYAFTESLQVSRLLEFHYGVEPQIVKSEPKTPEACVREAVDRKIISKTDVLAVTLGQFSSKPATNTIYYIDMRDCDFAGYFSKKQ